MSNSNVIEFRQYARKGTKRRGLIVALVDPNDTWAVGYSLCKLTDKFSPQEGYRIAKERAEKNLAKARTGVTYPMACIGTIPPYAFNGVTDKVLSRISRIYTAASVQNSNAVKPTKKVRKKSAKRSRSK